MELSPLKISVPSFRTGIRQQFYMEDLSCDLKSSQAFLINKPFMNLFAARVRLSNQIRLFQKCM